MAKITVSTKSEAKDRQIELSWRKRDAAFTPRISKEYAWTNFEKLRDKALNY